MEGFVEDFLCEDGQGSLGWVCLIQQRLSYVCRGRHLFFPGSIGARQSKEGASKHQSARQ